MYSNHYCNTSQLIFSILFEGSSMSLHFASHQYWVELINNNNYYYFVKRISSAADILYTNTVVQIIDYKF